MSLAMGESAVQYSLTQNRLFCVQLNYQSISAHLIGRSIITATQDEEIKLKHGDSLGRMEELVSLLLTLNSATAFIAFQEAVNDSGESQLRQKLLRDYNLISERHRLMTLSPPKCFFDPWILKTIFSHIGSSDLLSFRGVCYNWNHLITECMAHRFSIKFQYYQQMTHFMNNIGTQSELYRKIETFSFTFLFPCTAMDFSAGAAFYKAFFAEFGPNIKQLRVLDSGGDMLLLMLSKEIQLYLRNIKILTMDSYLSRALNPADTVFTFPKLDSLYLNVASDKLQGMLYFLEKFVKSDHHLRVFVLQPTPPYPTRWMLTNQLPDFPEDIIRGLFKNNSIESFELLGSTKIVRLDNNCMQLMTPANGEDTRTLKSWNGTLGYVQSNTFNNFLIAHKHTLATMDLCCNNDRTCHDLMHGLPVLENCALASLTIRLGESQLGWESFSSLSFLEKLPSLKHLEMKGIHDMTPMEIQAPYFRHLGLKQLQLELGFPRIETGCTVLALLPYVVDCFPNLNSLEVSGAIRWAWPIRLGPLELMNHGIPGSNQNQNKAIWTSGGK